MAKEPEAASKEAGLRFLALDGGQPGKTELSELVLLRKLLEKVEWEENLFETPPPHRYFDLIGGSGTGGIFALFFGRLQMSVDDAIQAYYTLYSNVFSTEAWLKKDLEASTKLLQETLQEIFGAVERDLDEPFEQLSDQTCRSFVCTLNPDNITHPRLLRSYRSRSGRGPKCSIREALLTSIADQEHVGSIALGASPVKEMFIGASQRFSNPTYQVIAESQTGFKGKPKVACIVSLGMGHPGPLCYPSAGPVDYESLVRQCEDSERQAEIIGRSFQGLEDFFFRFNVAQGMQPLQRLERTPDFLSIVATNSEQYCEEVVINKKMNVLVKILSERSALVSPDRMNSLCGADVKSHLYAAVEEIKSGIREIRENQSDFISNKYLDELRPLNAEDKVKRRPCMDGTREEILKQVDDWIDDKDSSRILWISGYPGTGKSAVAMSIIERLRARVRLGSAFFFERDNAKQKCTSSLWRQVAFDLSRRIPRLASFVTEKLKTGQVDASRTTANRLFHHLIEQPLKSDDIKQCLVSEITPVIVIDALDECGGLEGSHSEDRKDLLNNLRQWTHFRIKIIVTSREADDVLRTLLEPAHRLFLEAGESAKTSPDITRYLERELQTITTSYPSLASFNWPGPDAIRALTERASGLFIWASTAVRIIEYGDPVEQLEALNQVTGSLYDLYHQILISAFKAEPSDHVVSTIKAVCGALILAKRPLRFEDITQILEIRQSTLELIQNGLRPVLNDSEGTVRFSHQSFVDYLCDSSCPDSFYFDKDVQSRRLALTTLVLLRRNLRFNICDFPSSYLMNDKVEDLPQRMRGANVTPAVIYCCQFWASHVADSPFSSDLLSQTNDFFDKYFLFWLELLSLLGSVSTASRSISWLTEWNRSEDSFIRMKLKDARLFLSAFGTLISQSAPHVYLSALPFTPSSSWTQQNFVNKFRNILGIQKGQENNWTAEETCIEGHTSWVTSVAFSPDGKRVVSGSSDKTIRIWNADTGELVSGPFEGHTDWVSSVAFSPDGKRVISGSDNQTIRIWDAVTGELVSGPFEGHRWSVPSVAFSPDGERVVSGSNDKTICIWDADTGELVSGPFEGHTDCVSSVAFSPDGKSVISGSLDQTIRIWDADTGELVSGLFEGHIDWVTSVAFSPDGKRTVSGSHDQTVRIWDADTGELVSGPFEGHTGSVSSVAFSPDGKRVVSGSLDQTIRIWDAETGSKDTLNGDRRVQLGADDDAVWEALDDLQDANLSTPV